MGQGGSKIIDAFTKAVDQGMPQDAAKLLQDPGFAARIVGYTHETKGTFLYYCCTLGTPQFVRLLLRAGAKPNFEQCGQIPRPLGRRPLTCALLRGHGEVVRLLIDEGLRGLRCSSSRLLCRPRRGEL